MVYLEPARQLIVLLQIAVAAMGSIEGLLDYNRLRADMSSLIH
jgi:hypothetical protein